MHSTAASPELHYDSIHSNSFAGPYGFGVVTVNAENNWWGSPTGPNPPGKGDAVFGNVDVTPCLTKAPKAA